MPERRAKALSRGSVAKPVGGSSTAKAAGRSAAKPAGRSSAKPAGSSAAKPANLKQIAEYLGLSKAAISRVLNNAPAARSIPKATQDRIVAAAKQFNYRPNVLARSLRRGHSLIIGVLVPELSEGYATLVLAGVEEALLKGGYVFFLVSHHHRPQLIASSYAMLLERSVDGIIAIDTPLDTAGDVPTITVSCPETLPGITSIVLNHRRAAELAIDHLVGLGHRSIAFIRGQLFSSDAGPRWQTIRQAMQRAGLSIDKRLVAQLEGDAPTNEPGYFAAQQLLAEGVAFTALFAFNDISAIGAIRALREAGLRVPQDVSVVGFDDVQSAAFQNPALTTVRQPLRTMGMLAADHLVRQIAAAEASPAKQIVVDPELVVRESTRPVSRHIVSGHPAPRRTNS
jgi:DNA-binding LacI/PurR family transcriptional regulator